MRKRRQAVAAMGAEAASAERRRRREGRSRWLSTSPDAFPAAQRDALRTRDVSARGCDRLCPPAELSLGLGPRRLRPVCNASPGVPHARIMLSTAHRALSRRRLSMHSQLVSSARRGNSSKTATAIPTLPRLPVPALHQTLKAYLKSLEPFLLEDEARGGSDFKSAYDARLKFVEDFERGLGQLCQQRLLGTLHITSSRVACA